MATEPMHQIIGKFAGKCVAARLRMLNRVVTNIYDDALRSLDMAGSGARRGWPLAAVSPDAAGTQAPGKGGSGLERGTAAGQKSAERWVRGAVEPVGQAAPQRGRRKLIFLPHSCIYNTRKRGSAS